MADRSAPRPTARALRLAVLGAVLATSSAGRPPPPADACSLDSLERRAAEAAGAMAWPLAVTPAFAEPRGGAPTPDELAGGWTGTASITAARSPLKPVESAMAPHLGVARDVEAEASSSSSGATFAFGGKGGGWSCPFTLARGTLTCTAQVNGYRMTMTGALTRSGAALRVSGSWSASQPMLTLHGSWSMEKPSTDVEIELLHPAGRSPKVFTSGWLFGARCVRGKGTPREVDLTAQVEWGGTATFTPQRGTPVRPRFATAGMNKLTLTCDGAKKTFVIETVGTARFARMGHRAQAPADAHGCPACPHPTVTGPIVQGSPSVLIDGYPAARVGDYGLHAACCGANTFRITGGNDHGVVIDGRPATTLGAATVHCGGRGKLIEGAAGTYEPPSFTEASGGFFGLPSPAPPARAPAPGPRATASSTAAPTGEPPVAGDVKLDAPAPEDLRGASATLRTEPGATRVVRNTPDGAASPACAIAILPSSEITRRPEGTIHLTRGAIVVTTLPPAKQLIETDAGTVELGSQARIARVDGGVDVALLAGSATLRPRSGPELRLSVGQSVRFTAKGAAAPPATMAPTDVGDAVRGLVDPKTAGATAAPEEELPAILRDRRLWMALGAGVAIGAVVMAAVVIALASRRKRGPAAR